MKCKLFTILGLCVILLFVISCAPGEKSFAGKAVDLGKVKQPVKSVGTGQQEKAPQLGESKPELCDNNVDDNGDGKVDCADPKCANYITSDGRNHDAACVNGLRKICDGKSVAFGSVFNWKTPEGGVDIVCYGNGKYGSFGECSVSKGVVAKKGPNGVVKNLHDVVLAGDINYICSYKQINGKDFQSWVGCNGNLGPDGVKVNVGEENSNLNGGFFCNGKTWSTEVCDNGKDDNGDGKVDCLDPLCSGFVGTDGNKRDYVCAKGGSTDKSSQIKNMIACGQQVPSDKLFATSDTLWLPRVEFGDVITTDDKSELYCYNNAPYSSLVECDTDGKVNRLGKAGMAAKFGQKYKWNSKSDALGVGELLCSADNKWDSCGFGDFAGDSKVDGFFTDSSYTRQCAKDNSGAHWSEAKVGPSWKYFSSRDEGLALEHTNSCTGNTQPPSDASVTKSLTISYTAVPFGDAKQTVVVKDKSTGWCDDQHSGKMIYSYCDNSKVHRSYVSCTYGCEKGVCKTG